MQARTLSVRSTYDSMGLVTLTSWGCYFLLYSLRKPTRPLALMVVVVGWRSPF